MLELPNKKYKIILADPPWNYNNWSKLKSDKLSKKCGRMLYSTMNLNEICDLQIDKIADKECILFLWATMPCLEQAFEVIKAWGFIYKCCAFSWVKTTSKGIYSGLGNWTLGNIELCLLATHKGFPKRQKPVKQVVLAKRGVHSKKPDEVRKRIVTMMGDLPRIELFARDRKQGWDAWGNEVPTECQNILSEVSGNSSHN